MEQNRDDELSEIAVKFGENLTLDSSINHEIEHNVDDDDDDVCVIVDDNDDDDDDDDDDEEGEFEFSFAGGELPSPVSADDAFLNGQIRPVITFADEAAAETSHAPPVKRLFVVSAPAAEEGEAAEGEYCAWSPTVSPATEMSRKSNSTGFSRLWRVKDLLVRSHSDGKDTFVFLPSSKEAEKKSKKTADLGRINVERRKIEGETTSRAKNVGGEREGKKGKKAATTTASVAAYEALYGNKERRHGGGRGKSYLPYKQDLVGFFTNVNGFTRNVHPY